MRREFVSLLQTPAADFLVTVYAGAEAVTFNPNQGQLDVAADRGFAIEAGDREFSL